MTSSGMWKAIMVGLVVIAVVIPHAEMALASTGTWSAKAPMPAARYGLGIAVVNGIPYRVGGVATGRLAAVEAYEPGTDTWSTKASMPTARADLAIAVVNEILYAVGGTAGGVGGMLNTVEAYDPSTGTWT